MRHLVDAAGWTLEPGTDEDPMCDASRVARELGIAPTTARRWMRDGTVPCTTSVENGRPRRRVRLSVAWSLWDRRADRILLPELAIELGARYHELYQDARRLGLLIEQHPTSRQFDISPDEAQQLRNEHDRVRRLHARAIKVSSAARDLNRAVSTIGLMMKRGELALDPETDSSGARFVSRASVEAVLTAMWGTGSASHVEGATLPLAAVIRFTGRSRTELMDLVHAGTLEQVPGRQRCELTMASLKLWLASTA